MIFPANCHIAVFTKPPTPGRVKTRLIPALDAHGAAALHERMLVRTLETVLATGASAALWVAGDPTDRALQRCCGRFAFPMQEQVGTDLGKRMAAALRASLQAHPKVLLIGTDCPALTAAHLLDAAERLEGDTEAVFIPAQDGGYVLVGMCATSNARLDMLMQAAFEDVPWSTEKVMRVTRSRLSAQRIGWAELPPLWDVDRPEDLARWPEALR